MTIRLSAMFEDRVDSVLRDWYESASGGARRTRLRTMRLLESQAPESNGVSRQRMPHSGNQAASVVASSSGVRSNSVSLNARESRTRTAATRAATTSETDQRNGHRHSVRTETRGSSRTNPQPRHDRDSDNVFDETELSVSERPIRSTRSTARRELVMRFPASRIRQSSQEEGVSNGPLTSRYSTRRSVSLAQSSASVNDEESDDEEEEEDEEGEEEQEGSDEEEEEEQGDDSEGDEDEEEEEEDEDDEEEEEEESDDSTEDSRHQTRRKAARPTHRPTVTVRADRSANTSTRSKNSKPSARNTRRTSDTSQRNANANPAPARRSLRRNSSARRVRYNENDSDSESDSVSNEVIAVSSRGRVRKPAIRMQDYVE